MPSPPSLQEHRERIASAERARASFARMADAVAALPQDEVTAAHGRLLSDAAEQLSEQADRLTGLALADGWTAADLAP